MKLAGKVAIITGHPDDIVENLTQPEAIAEAIFYLVCQPASAYTQELIVTTPLPVKAG